MIDDFSGAYQRAYFRLSYHGVGQFPLPTPRSCNRLSQSFLRVFAQGFAFGSVSPRERHHHLHCASVRFGSQYLLGIFLPSRNFFSGGGRSRLSLATPSV